MKLREFLRGLHLGLACSVCGFHELGGDAELGIERHGDVARPLPAGEKLCMDPPLDPVHQLGIRIEHRRCVMDPCLEGDLRQVPSRWMFLLGSRYGMIGMIVNYSGRRTPIRDEYPECREDSSPRSLRQGLDREPSASRMRKPPESGSFRPNSEIRTVSGSALLWQPPVVRSRERRSPHGISTGSSATILSASTASGRTETGSRPCWVSCADWEWRGISATRRAWPPWSAGRSFSGHPMSSSLKPSLIPLTLYPGRRIWA